MRKRKQDTNSKTYKLFEILPILPDPAANKKQLAKRLGMSSDDFNSLIMRLPGYLPIYEDKLTIGRIK